MLYSCYMKSSDPFAWPLRAVYTGFVYMRDTCVLFGKKVLFCSLHVPCQSQLKKKKKDHGKMSLGHVNCIERTNNTFSTS